MEKKISDLEYSEIAAAINGYLNSEASIKQYVYLIWEVKSRL